MSLWNCLLESVLHVHCFSLLTPGNFVRAGCNIQPTSAWVCCFGKFTTRQQQFFIARSGYSSRQEALEQVLRLRCTHHAVCQKKHPTACVLTSFLYHINFYFFISVGLKYMCVLCVPDFLCDTDTSIYIRPDSFSNFVITECWLDLLGRISPDYLFCRNRLYLFIPSS